MNFIKQFIRDEEGVTAIEYGLIGAFMAVLIASFATNFSTALQGKLQVIIDQIGDANPLNAVTTS